MKSYILRTTKVLGASSLLFILPYSAAASTLAEELKACSEITNVMERLVCYDELAERAEELAGEEPTAATGQRRAAEARELGERRRVEGGAAQERGQELSEEAQQRAEERREEAERRAEEAQRRAEEAERRAQDAEERAEQARGQRQQSGPISEKTYIEIVDAWQNPRGLWRFELSSGDVYEQVNPNRMFQYQEDGNYYLDPGFMNSLALGRDGSNTRIRVRKRN